MCRRARLSVLPALALLFGALSLSAPGPALAQSSDNTLRALTVEVSTDGATFSRAGIHPEFSPGQLSYDTVVSTSHTHVRVTPTANHAAARLKVAKGTRNSDLKALASGATSAAFALASGANQIRVQVTAQDGDTESYWVTVYRGGNRIVPAPPRYVQASAGTAKLTLTWTAPVHWGSFPAGGYEVDWYAGSSPPMDDSDWKRATPVASPLAASATSYEFTGTYGSHTVADGTAYQLRVRAFSTNPNDDGDTLAGEWVVTAGTPPGGSSRSSDARLSGLTASGAASAQDTFSALTLAPSFDAATTIYTATVANAITHAKLTPTANHASASVGVRKGSTGNFTSVTSGSASAAIALEVGANAITVRVTAQDASTRDYTVTITRQGAGQSSDATLSGLTASVSTSETGTYSAQGLTPSTFDAATTSYTATVANAITHAKVTPTVNHAQATVGVRKGSTGNFAAVTSGSASGAIALEAGANAITVRVTAQDSSTKDYTVTITRQAAQAQLAAPGNFAVEAGDGAFTVSWNAVSGAGSYGMAISWPGGSGSFVAAGSATSRTFSALGAHTVTNGTTYTVRMRACSLSSYHSCSGQQYGAWTSSLTVTPQAAAPQAQAVTAPTVSVTRRTSTVMDVTLTQPGGQGGITGYTIIYAPKDTPFSAGTPTAGNPFPTPEGWTRLTADDSCHRSSDLYPRAWCNGREGGGWWGGHAGGNRLTHRINALEPTTEYCVRARAWTRTRVSSADGRFEFRYSDWSDADCNSLYEYLQTQAGQRPLTERCAAHLPADAISVAEVTGWRDAHAHDASHVLRWNRVLEALGEDTGTGAAPLAAAESRANEFRYSRSRWSRVTGTLEGLGACVAAPAVWLAAPAEPVDEGSSVPVTVTLTSPLAGDLVVPLTVTRGTSEDGDHGTLASLTVPAGASSASGRIATVEDADTDDETFTVALGALPATVQPGAPDTATVTIRDTTADGQQAAARPLMERCAAHLPANAVSVAQVTGWRDGHAHVAAHVERWNRVLAALGADVPAGVTAMTAAEARENERRYMPARWAPVRATLEGIEACLAGPGDREPPAPAVPEVLIAAGAGVTEGAAASFTLTAYPAPAADLGVSVTVSQGGAVADALALGERTVTIAAGATSAAFTVATVDDAVDEPDGAIVATLASGAGYTVGDAARAAVAVADDDLAPPEILTTRAIAREGSDDAVVFRVLLRHAAAGPVTVDYATADGSGAWARTPPATAGADYTAVSGTLAFAAGSTLATVSVPIPDDAIDEGTEYFLLRFSNPQGATLTGRHRETQGLIRNDDHLQAMWLARFGRTVGSQVTDAVSGRLEDGLAPGAHATLAGQSLDLSKAEDGQALADAMTGLARAFGASGAPANGEPGSQGAGLGLRAGGASDPFARHGLGGAWNGPGSTAAARDFTGREVLLGSAFHVAPAGDGSGPGLAVWGRAAHGSFDGEHVDPGSGSPGSSPGQAGAGVDGRTRVDGEVVTGVLGADADFGRVLAGVAVSLSEGEGKFSSPGVDRGKAGRIESTMTTVSPYARFTVTDRISAWGLAGFGNGDMTIRFDDGSMAPVRTDLSMQLGAVGARGALLTQDGAGGMDLALKADAFFVRTESEKAANSVETEADASRVRLVLEGGRRFALSETATLRPSLEVGVRHDGGDAETGAGVELGGGVAWTDTASGLSVEARARLLVAHGDSDYEEWGASATARLDPGERGRGLSFSLSPVIGASGSATERLWGARNARSLAPGGAFEAARGLTAEAGYGMALFGDRFTATPSLGFGMADGGQREYRLGWRLTSVVRGDPGFEVSLDATRREPANPGSGSGAGKAEHGVMVRSLIRW